MMNFADKKIFIATFAAFILSNFSCGKVIAAENSDTLFLDKTFKESRGLSKSSENNYGQVSFLNSISSKNIAIYDGIFTRVFGGVTSRGDVFDNEISIYGGLIGNVYGGISEIGSVYGNTINIYDGIFTGEIVGGKITNPQQNSITTRNVINIYGGNLVRASLKGGVIGEGYSSTGNFLNINVAGLTVREIIPDSFEKIIFNLPSNVRNGTTILSVKNGNNIPFDKISFAINGKSELKPGDKINLSVKKIEDSETSESSADVSENNVTAETNSSVVNSKKTYVTQGATLNYEVEINETSSGSITATVGNFVEQTSNPIPQSNNADFIRSIIPELDPFSDIMTDAELYKIKFNNDKENFDEGEMIFDSEDFLDLNEYKFFFNKGNKNVTTKSGGGDIKTSRESYNLGFARSFKTDYGKIYVAPVFESAKGNYNATLFNNVFGSGDIKYSAGGFIARIMKNNGFYYEGSFRTGKTENNFASNDFLISGEKTYVSYSMEAPVFTGHLRIGNAFKIDQNNFLDLYGIYFATHQSGKTATLSTGEDVKFNSSTAQTFRIGCRLTTRTSLISKVYGGLAWQYEKNSDSIATATNYLQRADGATGSSAMMELGWQIKPNKHTTWTLDLNATGWVGRQRGFNFLVNAQKSF